MTIGGNPFAARLETDGAAYRYFPVASIEGSEALPYALKVLLENVLRKAEDPESARELARRIVEAGLAGTVGDEVEFSPARVLIISIDKHSVQPCDRAFISSSCSL